MSNALEQLSSDLLTFNRGIERETLRSDPRGGLSRQPHPEFLGSKLTHPMITTDFSESQLELITPVNRTVDGALSISRRIHRYIAAGLVDEYMWPLSMPCLLPQDGEIPLAYYGDSNLGRLKTTYRNGLGLRYGRSMQTICAIHYNFSFSDEFWVALQDMEGSGESAKDYRSRRYFDLMRNFRRWSWLLLYLFGASPSVAKNFAEGKIHNFEQRDIDTLFLPYATSLRSGGLGYQSNTQSGMLKVCYNSLPNYVQTLCEGICTPHEAYQKLGGPQVNQNILQSEAEFYTSIRAKCVPPSGTNFLAELASGGVEYIEVRLLDINPFEPLGIQEQQIRFIDAFLLHCLLSKSPQHDDVLCENVAHNMMQTVSLGRKKGLELRDGASTRPLQEWGLSLLEDMSDVVSRLDHVHGGDHFAAAVAAQHDKLDNPELTPSAQLLKVTSDCTLIEFGIEQARTHSQTLLAQPVAGKLDLAAMAADSAARFAAIKADQQDSFTGYLDNLQQGYDHLLDSLRGE